MTPQEDHAAVETERHLRIPLPGTGDICPTLNALAGTAPGVQVFLKIGYRGTALIRNRQSLGPYKRPRPRALWWS